MIPSMFPRGVVLRVTLHGFQADNLVRLILLVSGIFDLCIADSLLSAQPATGEIGEEKPVPCLACRISKLDFSLH